MEQEQRLSQGSGHEMQIGNTSQGSIRSDESDLRRSNEHFDEDLESSLRFDESSEERAKYEEELQKNDVLWKNVEETESEEVR